MDLSSWHFLQLLVFVPFPRFRLSTTRWLSPKWDRGVKERRAVTQQVKYPQVCPTAQILPWYQLLLSDFQMSGHISEAQINLHGHDSPKDLLAPSGKTGFTPTCFFLTSSPKNWSWQVTLVTISILQYLGGVKFLQKYFAKHLFCVFYWKSEIFRNYSPHILVVTLKFCTVSYFHASDLNFSLH